jgi:hypothetical protein
MYRWNARGDLSSHIVLWIGVLIACIISIIWLVQNLRVEHVTMQKVENELTDLQHALNNACRMHSYRYDYYPKLNEGNLILNNLQVCIDSAECRVLFYSGTANATKNGADIEISGSSCPDISDCKSVYYESAFEPEFAGAIRIPEASFCSPPSAYRRCRILMCDLGLTKYIQLDKIVYFTLEKDQYDTFTITEH